MNHLIKTATNNIKLKFNPFFALALAVLAGFLFWFLPKNFILVLPSETNDALHHAFNYTNAWMGIIIMSWPIIVCAIPFLKREEINYRVYSLIRNISLTTISIALLVPSFFLGITAMYSKMITIDGTKTILIISWILLYGGLLFIITWNYIKFTKKDDYKILFKRNHQYLLLNSTFYAFYGSLLLLGTFGAFGWGLGISETSSSMQWTWSNLGNNWLPVSGSFNSSITAFPNGTGFMGTIFGNWQGYILAISAFVFIIFILVLMLLTSKGKFATLTNPIAEEKYFLSTITLVIIASLYFIISFTMSDQVKNIHFSNTTSGSLKPTSDGTTTGEVITTYSTTNRIIIGNPMWYFGLFISYAILALLNIIFMNKFMFAKDANLKPSNKIFIKVDIF